MRCNQRLSETRHVFVSAYLKIVNEIRADENSWHNVLALVLKFGKQVNKYINTVFKKCSFYSVKVYVPGI